MLELSLICLCSAIIFFLGVPWLHFACLRWKMVFLPTTDSSFKHHLFWILTSCWVRHRINLVRLCGPGLATKICELKSSSSRKQVKWSPLSGTQKHGDQEVGSERVPANSQQCFRPGDSLREASAMSWCLWNLRKQDTWPGLSPHLCFSGWIHSLLRQFKCPSCIFSSLLYLFSSTTSTRRQQLAVCDRKYKWPFWQCARQDLLRVFIVTRPSVVLWAGMWLSWQTSL